MTALPLRIAVALGAAAVLAAGFPGPADAAYRTGRYLVSFERASTVRSSGTLSAVLARTGAASAGRGVPQLGIATVRGRPTAIARLRRDPSVRSVSEEWARDLRRMPNDPALSAPETAFPDGVPPGTPIQWALARAGFPRAWDVTTGDGAIVGVIDSGIDGANPELASKVSSADAVGTADPLVDPDGHGSHVAGLACAATDDGVGTAGAGWGCRLAVVKFAAATSGVIRDEDVVGGIVLAIERGAQAINMSFGGGDTSPALRQAVDLAVSRGVVLAAAASNAGTFEQGAPAVELQPGDAPNLDAGRGLVVTAAEFDDTGAGTGAGPQISLAAYGFFDEGPLGPPGLISTYPGGPTPREGLSLEGPPCGCRGSIGGDGRYAYLAGTSMATPQVTALAALVSELNPSLTLPEKLRLIKETARRPGGWTPELGWGIIDAGRAIDAARRVDRAPPGSRARAARRVPIRPGARRARLRVRWAGADRAAASRLLPSGVAGFDLYLRRDGGPYRPTLRGTPRRTALLRLRPGTYRLFTRARDRQGNVEPRPRRADVRVVVRRSR